MGHLNKLLFVIRKNKYSLREEVIRIFESLAGNPTQESLEREQIAYPCRTLGTRAKSVYAYLG